MGELRIVDKQCPRERGKRVSHCTVAVSEKQTSMRYEIKANIYQQFHALPICIALVDLKALWVIHMRIRALFVIPGLPLARGKITNLRRSHRGHKRMQAVLCCLEILSD